MAQYKKQTMVGGKWAKAAEIKATKAKIVSETSPQTSTFLNKDGSQKTQDVCKVQFQGIPEALNVSLNRATINGWVDAFGDPPHRRLRWNDLEAVPELADEDR